MISAVLRFFVLLLLALFAFGCHQSVSKSDITIEHEISPQPARVGTAAIRLKLKDKDGKPLHGARVELEGNMTHPGMSPVNGETRETAPGEYGGSLQFTMAGDWIILVNITLADGKRVQRQIEVRGVKSE